MGAQGARRWWWLAALVGLSLVVRAQSLWTDVLDLDETAHLVGAREWLAGRIPYAEFVNNKPPLLYVYYAIAQWPFGSSLVGVHWVTALVAVPLTAWALVVWHRHRRAGFTSAALYIVMSASFLAHDMLATHSEIVMLLPAAWAVAVVRDEREALAPSRTLAAGVLLGLSVLGKQQGVLWVVALTLVIAFAGWRRAALTRALGALASFGAGVLVPAIVAAGYFHAHGALDDLVYWTLWNNLEYAANPILAREAVERALTSLVPFLLVTAPLWVIAIGRVRERRVEYGTVAAAALLVCSLPAMAIGFRFYPHYFLQVYLPLCMLAGPRIDAWFDTDRARFRTFAGYVVALWLVFFVVNLALYAVPGRVYRETSPAFAELGARLAADPCAASGVFVWGYAPVIYYHAGRPAGSRFVVLAQAGLTPYVSGNLAAAHEETGGRRGVAQHWHWLFEDLDTRRPGVFVDTSAGSLGRWGRFPLTEFPRLASYVAQHYAYAGGDDRLAVYRRRDCPPPTPPR
ncbi:MAG: hypothetical protein KJ061_08780 [Vicinamibacteraceae bacterium]|nr:hypothetical protein [Vicinamibacteraceae bacterium]